MRILILADQDAMRDRGQTGPADLVLSCGDVPDPAILEAAEASGCEQVFAVKGNHDAGGGFPDPIVDVHMSVREFRGVKVGGFNGCWKYKPRGHFLYEEAEVEQLMRVMPAVDVFVAHNSPRGVHDREDGVHLGFSAFNDYIEEHRPALFVHGHQHTSAETQVADTRVIGVVGRRLLEWEPPG